MGLFLRAVILFLAAYDQVRVQVMYFLSCIGKYVSQSSGSQALAYHSAQGYCLKFLFRLNCNLGVINKLIHLFIFFVMHTFFIFEW